MPLINVINYAKSDEKPVEYVGVKVTPFSQLLIGVINLRMILQNTPETLDAVSVVANNREEVINKLIEKNIGLKDKDEFHIIVCDKPVKELMGIDVDAVISPKALHEFVTKAIDEYQKSLDDSLEILTEKEFEQLLLALMQGMPSSTPVSQADKVSAASLASGMFGVSTVKVEPASYDKDIKKAQQVEKSDCRLSK